jgi:hypothetical protein
MPLRHINHQRANVQIRILRKCCCGQRCCLKHWAIRRTAPHQVIPDPEAIDRRCGQERSGAQPGIPLETNGAESDAY